MENVNPISPLDEIPTDFREQLQRANIKQTMKSYGATPRDIYMVPIENIHVWDGFNVRVDDESLRAHVRQIADSIKETGFRQDEILGGFVALNGEGIPTVFVHKGHCRLRAALLAKEEGAPIHALPLVTVPKEEALEDLTTDLFTSNNNRKPLTPYEAAIVCKRLTSFGWTTQKIAQHLTRSVTWVENMLSIMGAPLSIREMIQSGAVTVTMACEAMVRYGPTAAEKLQTAVHVAGEQGKSRASAKHLPGRRFENYVKRTAPKLFEAACAVKNDPGYQNLAPETREILDALLQEAETKKEESTPLPD